MAANSGQVVSGLKAKPFSASSRVLWDLVPAATEYSVVWDLITDSPDVVVHSEVRASRPPVLIERLVSGCSYSIAVAAVSSTGKLGPYCHPIVVTTEALAGPSGGTVVEVDGDITTVRVSIDKAKIRLSPGEVELNWRSKGNAGRFVCFEVRAALISTPACVESFMCRSDSLVLRSLLPDQDYALCVAAVSADGERSPFSEPALIKTLHLTPPIAVTAVYDDFGGTSASVTTPAGFGSLARRPSVAVPHVPRITDVSIASQAPKSFTLKWSAVPGAIGYETLWGMGDSTDAPISGRERSSTPTVTVEGLSARSEYTATVTPIMSDSSSGLPSNPLRIRLAAAEGRERRPSHAPRIVSTDVMCSAGLNGQRYFQPTTQCDDCGQRVCEACLAICHSGHRITISTVYAAFTCECVISKCRAGRD